jgi:hypothetical protein
VHKDFHGALSYGIDFVVEQHGLEGLREYLAGLADTVYAPLVERLRSEGLAALRDHWREVFTLEEGKFELHEDDGVLTLEVIECPAIAHIKARGYAISPHFCEHTRLLNEAICERAGYACSTESDQAAGRCVQRFWKAAP